MENPAPGRDPYVIGFLAFLAIVLLAGAAFAIRAYLRYEPAATAAKEESVLAKLGTDLQRTMRDMHERIRSRISDANGLPSRQPPPATSDTPAVAAPVTGTPLKTDPQRIYPAGTAPPAPQVLPVPANAAWTYKVFFGPSWTSNGQLTYRTRPASGTAPPEADMSWQPDGGQPYSWAFGTVAAGHPSHGNTRFPGFFMHAAYLPETLTPGQMLRWEFPWQGGNAGLPQSERVRRFDFKVAGWEKVKVEAGEFDAARLDGTLRYMEKDAVKAEIQYNLWYAPRARQTVRLRWLGRAPDEGSTQMIAELLAVRLP